MHIPPAECPDCGCIAINITSVMDERFHYLCPRRPCGREFLTTKIPPEVQQDGKRRLLEARAGLLPATR
jgi:hypothetical protein